MLAAVATGTFSAGVISPFATHVSILGRALIPQAVVESMTGVEDVWVYFSAPAAIGCDGVAGDTVLSRSTVAAFVCSAALGSS